MQIRRANAPRCGVGEGPVWDVREQALYCVDILGKAVHRYDPESGAVEPHALPRNINPRAQFNDGKVDRRGRFVVGSGDSQLRDTQSIGSPVAGNGLDRGVGYTPIFFILERSRTTLSLSTGAPPP